MVGLLNRLGSSCSNKTVIWWSSELPRRTGLESNHSPCPLVAGNRTALTSGTTLGALLPTLPLSYIIPSFVKLLDSMAVKMIAWHSQLTLPQEELVELSTRTHTNICTEVCRALYNFGQLISLSLLLYLSDEDNELKQRFQTHVWWPISILPQTQRSKKWNWKGDIEQSSLKKWLYLGRTAGIPFSSDRTHLHFAAATLPYTDSTQVNSV